MLSAYDELMENNRRRMELLEESARLLYREWFVRLRFPGHEHTRITNGVPEGWERKLSTSCRNHGTQLFQRTRWTRLTWRWKHMSADRCIDGVGTSRSRTRQYRFATCDICSQDSTYLHKVGRITLGRVVQGECDSLDNCNEVTHVEQSFSKRFPSQFVRRMPITDLHEGRCSMTSPKQIVNYRAMPRRNC